jgi:hypothetical protein
LVFDTLVGGIATNGWRVPGLPDIGDQAVTQDEVFTW